MSNEGSIVRKLNRLGLINGIKPFQIETDYEVIMGSFAYGVSSDMSDTDVYGLYCPPIEQLFPHIKGHINGFGKPVHKDDSFQQHGILVNDGRGREYDLALTSVAKYFQLCMDNNPNMIDSLFVPSRCVIHTSAVGDVLRDNRRMFLHKGIKQKLMGYAYSQLKKLDTKVPEVGSKRYDMVKEHGYDVKFAYHVVRLVQQAEMVMVRGDLDLEENRELLKGIRRGEWTLPELKAWFQKRQDDLETLYTKSTLRYEPDTAKIKELLLQCLEIKFGSLSKYFNLEGSNQIALNKLKRINAICVE